MAEFPERDRIDEDAHVAAGGSFDGSYALVQNEADGRRLNARLVVTISRGYLPRNMPENPHRACREAYSVRYTRHREIGVP